MNSLAKQRDGKLDEGAWQEPSLWVDLRQQIIIARLEETLNCVLQAPQRSIQLVVEALSARNARTVLRWGQVQVGRMM